MPEIYAITVTELFGLVGVVLYIAAYAGIQLGVIYGGTVVHTGISLIAAIFVLISLSVNFNISSALIQSFFILFSIIGFARIYLNTRPLILDSTQTRIAETLLPGLPLRRASVLLSKGKRKFYHNKALIEQGTPIDALMVVISGGVQITRNGKHLHELKDFAVVGEVTCLTGDPATATVAVRKDAELFIINREVLFNILNKNTDIRRAFEIGRQNAIYHKLSIANSQLAQQSTHPTAA